MELPQFSQNIGLTSFKVCFTRNSVALNGLDATGLEIGVLTVVIPDFICWRRIDSL